MHEEFYPFSVSPFVRSIVALIVVIVIVFLHFHSLYSRQSLAEQNLSSYLFHLSCYLARFSIFSRYSSLLSFSRSHLFYSTHSAASNVRLFDAKLNNSRNRLLVRLPVDRRVSSLSHISFYQIYHVYWLYPFFLVDYWQRLTCFV